MPVMSAAVTVAGVRGDRQAHRQVHGGPERAICLYSLDLMAALRAEGHQIVPGTLGENFTVAGIDWSLVQPGCEFAVGPVRLRVTTYASPCTKVRSAFKGGAFERLSETLHPGWSRVYARVLQEGVVTTGDPVRLLPG